MSLGYEFDAVGNLGALRNGNQNDPPLWTFGYDALNRLTETKDGATSTLLQGYSYDATGNRQSATDAGISTHCTTATDSHRLSAVGAEVRGYDAVGNTTSIGGTARHQSSRRSGWMTCRSA
ncbi:MAG: RHS repeat protein [Pseudomonadota bacterium]|nr:RHS repeat protein [Pseudomonadota bacterium]